MKLTLIEIKRLFKKNTILLIVFLAFSILALFSYFFIDMNKDKIVLDNVNQIVLNTFDINKDIFTTVNGYYAFIFKLISIFISMYAISLGMEIATSNKRELTRDYLYTKPIKRKNIIINKIIGSFIILLSLCVLLFIASTILYLVTNKDFDLLKLMQMILSLFLLSVVFLGIGLVIGGFKNGNTPNIVPSLITTLIFLIIHVINTIFNLKWISYLNPFSYFKLSNIIINNSYDYSSLLVSLALIVFLINFGISLYEDTLKK